jgi:hypothetical protein
MGGPIFLERQIGQLIKSNRLCLHDTGKKYTQNDNHDDHQMFPDIDLHFIFFLVLIVFKSGIVFLANNN